MLKQLMLRKKLEQRKAALDELLVRQQGLKTRSEELTASIEEAKTDEEMEVVNEEVTKLETEQVSTDEQKTNLEREIAGLEGELNELSSKEPNKETETEKSEERKNSKIDRGQTRMKVNKYETRSEMIERLGQEEVREFYGKLTTAIVEKRALTGTENVIPESVIDMIKTMIGDYSKLYNEVTVEQLNGTARVILDGAIPEAVWTEMDGALTEIAASFSKVELDGWKVGGFVPVPNSVIEDSMINLANYVERRLAMAIAKALDKAIISGTAAGKQPVGVVTSLGADRKVDVANDENFIANLVAQQGLIDDGEDGLQIDEVIAVMKRNTYYKYIVPKTLLATSDGKYVVQTTATPRLPDGTRIVFNQYAGTDKILLGDYKKYILAERKGVQLASSTDVKFVEDQTVFKGTARYDGKPVDDRYFVEVTIKPAV